MHRHYRGVVGDQKRNVIMILAHQKKTRGSFRIDEREHKKPSFGTNGWVGAYTGATEDRKGCLGKTEK